MPSLRDFSDAFADAVQAPAASVVSVRSRRHPATGIAWTDELVVTASHVLKRDEGIVVTLPDGDERAAIVVGRDPATDLAVLKVADGGLTPVAWADELPRVGSLVIVLGRGRRLHAALGMVSDVGGAWQSGLGGQIDAWLEVDASLPRGASGGPLVDADGKVVGLNTSGLTQRGAVLPRDTVIRVAERLRDHGTTAPGYLGVGFYPGTLPDDAAKTAGQDDALMVVSLEPGGPGEGAGVKIGDALVRLDGQAVHGVRHLVGLLAGKGEGTEIELSFLRNGKPTDVAVALGARPARKRRGWGRCR